jgi:hypothetical protein
MKAEKIIQIGENMHILTIYLSKSAHFKFKRLFFHIYKNECLSDSRNLGLPKSSTSKVPQK